MIPYHGLIDIPEGKSGEWEVKHQIHPAGKPLVRVSMRTMLLGGRAAKQQEYDTDTRWHELYEGKSLWMTDLPIEQWQARQVVPALHGHVLVGGLGLGMVLQLLRRRRSVREITVIEYSSDCLRLVAPHHDFAKTRVTFVQADLADFLAAPPTTRFDTAFFDTWASDGEGTFWDTVLPLRMAARNHVRSGIFAWNEDIMRGQLVNGLRTRLAFDTTGDDMRIIRDGEPMDVRLTEYTGSKYHDWAVPFFQWVQANHTSLSMPQRQAAAVRYVRALDTPRGPSRQRWQAEF